MRFLIYWFVSTIAVIITAYLLPGVTLSSFWMGLLAAIVLAAVNLFIRPLLIFLTLPLNVLTLGLFTFVVNTFLILLVSAIVPGFKVNGFWWALLFSIVLSLVTAFLYWIYPW